MFDPERYRSKAEVQTWMERDPITLLKAVLEAAGELTADAWSELEQEVADEVREAVAFAEAGTLEPVDQLTRFVYSERAST
jgi:pyruvate dehydrogenase E1 component alpha subunit